jgi:hypothetical protein
MKKIANLQIFLVKKVRGSGFGTIIPDPDPTCPSSSGSARIQIHNTAFPDDSRSVSTRYLCQPFDIFTHFYLPDLLEFTKSK